jgi:hypothetical protein
MTLCICWSKPSALFHKSCLIRLLRPSNSDCPPLLSHLRSAIGPDNLPSTRFPVLSDLHAAQGVLGAGLQGTPAMSSPRLPSNHFHVTVFPYAKSEKGTYER